MINKNVIEFLKLLRKNNNREWFHKNKELYNRAKAEFEIFTNFMINEVQKIDRDIHSLTAKDCIFRIFRDVRFSKDKSPYKTNFGAFFVKGGKRSGNAGYYIHIEPANSFIAGGIHMPPSNILKSVRREIFENTGEFKSIINDRSFKNCFDTITGDKLVAAPQGFPKDFPDIELLKFKSYTVTRPVKDDAIHREDFTERVIQTFRIMYPFIHFINHAIDSGTE